MIILTLFIPVLPGLAVTAALLRGQARSFGFAEKLALGFVIGWAVHTIIMFLISLAGVPLIFANVLLADLAFSALLVLPFRRLIDWSGWRPAGQNRFALASLALLALIGLKAMFVTWSAFIRPVLAPDIIRCYAKGAKIIFLEQSILVGGPWANKPLMPFLSQAWTAIGPDAWNDAVLTLPHPLFYLCFLAIFYSALARYFKGWYALLATALLATVPFLAYQAGTAYTDFTQALYYSLATIYLFLFMKERVRNREASSSYLLIGSLLLGLSIWAKKSGLYYAAIDLSVVLLFLWTIRNTIRRTDWRLYLLSAALLAAVAFPWLLFNQLSVVKAFPAETAEVMAAVQTQMVPQNFPIIAAVFRNSFLEDNWHFLAMIFLAALAFYPRKALAGANKFLLLIAVLQFACLFAIFRFTYLYQFILNESIINRLTFHFIPVILYYCAEVIGAGEAKRLSLPGKED